MTTQQFHTTQFVQTLISIYDANGQAFGRGTVAQVLRITPKYVILLGINYRFFPEQLEAI